MGTYLVLDLETSIKNRGSESIGSMKASPWYPLNKIVMAGSLKESGSAVTIKEYPNLDDPAIPESIDIIIGHNIKFDCHYMMRDSESFRDALVRLQIWDTQLAEYILSGQTMLYPSLDQCSEKYGGVLKDDRIKEYWEDGVDTEDIPEEQLQEYLVHDVENTHLVFLAQLEKAVKMDMLPLIKSQMKALKATIEMEYNGMHFDSEVAEMHSDLLRDDLTDVEARVYAYMEGCGIQGANPHSGVHVGLLLFGGVQTVKEYKPYKDEDGEWVVLKSDGKSGKKGDKRLKKQDVNTLIAGKYMGKGSETASGKWKVDDETLGKLKGFVVEDIQQMRTLKKDISTYYEGYSKLVWPDGVIHHSLNHCATATGRLSSTKPNFQNVTSSE